jgi:hypothetical protein
LLSFYFCSALKVNEDSHPQSGIGAASPHNNGNNNPVLGLIMILNFFFVGADW